MRFINQSIAILGLGLESADLINWLSTNSANCAITIFDHKSKAELDYFIDKLPQGLTINFSFGQDYLKAGLNKFNLIFRSPGFYRLHPSLIEAQKNKVKISSPTKLFFETCPCPIIGVTGTKGKGTTVSLITAMLTASNQPTYLAGNIGKPVLGLLSRLKKSDRVCLELSSFQLQDLTTSPHLAVVLNITSEHLDVHRHHREYRQAKANLIRFQTRHDLAVINADYSFSRSLAKVTKAHVYWFSRFQRVVGSYVQHRRLYLKVKGQPILIGSVDKLLLRGEHNFENITAAIMAAYLAGASIEGIKKAVFNFKGLEHRLELVKEINGVKFYNDSFSTTPETAIAALKSFTEPKVIILGGSDKNSNYTALGRAIIADSHLKAVILIGAMADKIQAAINQAGRCNCPVVRNLSTMAEIVNQAVLFTQPGSVVILSPACASFDMFKNYKDRGNQFKVYVAKLH